MEERPLRDFLWRLFGELRRRQFLVGPAEYEALPQALRAGFGWSSPAALRQVCILLWAKSPREAEVLAALFDQLFEQSGLEAWDVPAEAAPPLAQETQQMETGGSLNITGELSVEVKRAESQKETPPPLPEPAAPAPLRTGGLPPISLDDVVLPERPFIFVPQFPLSYREAAQAWRRLRRPVRTGPPVELDVRQTIEKRSKRGVAVEAVLVPRRRNTARLLLLVDRLGSMAPYHAFVEEVCAAILQSGTLERKAAYYFHNAPSRLADPAILEGLPAGFFPPLDPILDDLPPCIEGFLYAAPDLTLPVPVTQVLEQRAPGAAVVIVSDAGATRRRYNPLRLLNTFAFLKAVKESSRRIIWLNPVPRQGWAGTSAAEIARHVPMFPLDRRGAYTAVDVLRGHPFNVERPL